jgi:hypothetical protein
MRAASFNSACSSLLAPCCSLILLLLSLAPVVARAGPPYITDDTGTQGRGNWQLELDGEYIHHNRSAPVAGATVDQERTVTSFSPAFTYGLAENVDLSFTPSYVTDRIVENGAVAQDAEGLSDSVMEIKWRFYERNGLSFAVKPALILPTGDESNGLGTGRVSWGVNGIVDYETGPWSLFANLAYAEVHFERPEDNQTNHRHLWRLSGALSYQVQEKLKLAAEAGVRTNPAKDDPFLPGNNGHFAMVGFIYSPSDKVDIALGFRKNVNQGEEDNAFPVGVTFRW